ncbi:hypothetical protein FRC08_003217 [Ceratobasidium sp. 394]|nr:hypothetical protein FRC08_003217 [Ceratobasidium sp. 394]
MREWRKHGFQLKRYLWELELEKEQKLKNLQEQRQVEIERRLISIGWTKSEISFHPHTSREWQELVQRPEPITEQNWEELYPLLNSLLWSNRAYDRAMERKRRVVTRPLGSYSLRLALFSCFVIFVFLLLALPVPA